MPIVAVRIPQIGEGLQEARLVGLLKKPGDTIKRDEPIYQMETDKAVMDVESPYVGTLVRWLADVDAILPIGGAVAEMDVAEGIREMEIHGAATGFADQPGSSVGAATPGTSQAARGANIPPRTRAYAKEKGISDDVLAQLASGASKLMPADIDSYLASGSNQPAAQATTGSGAGGTYSEVVISQKRRLVSSRLQRGSQLAVPGTISVAANWEPMVHLKDRMKAGGGEFQPSAFTCFAYAVVQALRDFPAFRSTLRGDEVMRTYDHVNLGIAVALPGDELVTAVVENADSLGFNEFATACRVQIELARTGKDQASEYVSVSLTNMQAFGLRDAVPVVVPPAVATLFLGAVHSGLDQDSESLKIQRQVILGLTFDHRAINGVGAAEFLTRAKENLEVISKHIVLG